jgi:hypothetical protein
VPLKHPTSKHHTDAAATHHEAGDHDKAKDHAGKAREHGAAAVEHGKKGHEESHK